MHDRGGSGRNFSHSRRIGAIGMPLIPFCSSESAHAQVLKNSGFSLTKLVAELAVCIFCGTVSGPQSDAFVSAPTSRRI